MKRLLSILLTMALIMIMPVALAEAVNTAPAKPLIDLTPLFQAIITLLAGLITYKLIPWIKANTSDRQQLMLESTARIGVYAAEQLFGALNGTQKLLFVKDYLRDKGYDVDTDEVKNTIEAMVQELTLEQAIQKPPDA
ncbi:MAG TPA: hypothetical protein GXZ91_04835 [Christensenellaceae bacterium]|jgi:hypothetical protein|nr:hypothetical protein [Christensenellaceae bacterium]